MSAIKTTTAKTKSGGNTMVAIIPVEMVGQLEALHWDASKIASQHKCSHYRVVNAVGQVIAAAKAGALPTQEQTARSHGDGSDWSRD